MLIKRLPIKNIIENYKCFDGFIDPCVSFSSADAFCKNQNNVTNDIIQEHIAVIRHL